MFMAQATTEMRSMKNVTISSLLLLLGCFIHHRDCLPSKYSIQLLSLAPIGPVRVQPFKVSLSPLPSFFRFSLINSFPAYSPPRNSRLKSC